MMFYMVMKVEKVVTVKGRGKQQNCNCSKGNKLRDVYAPPQVSKFIPCYCRCDPQIVNIRITWSFVRSINFSLNSRVGESQFAF